MWNITKQYFKNLWVYLWSLTTIDEKAKATGKEVKRRYRRTKKELADVSYRIGNLIRSYYDWDKISKRIEDKWG